MNEQALKQRISRDWNDWSEEYTVRSDMYLQSESQRKQWKKTLGDLIGDSPQTILDVGTGPGFLALLLAEMGHSCTGLDLSERMLSIAKQKAEQNQLACNFMLGDAEALPYDDNSFGVVVNRHLLWTLPHPGRALREWTRVLKTGGKLVIMDGEWSTATMNLKRKLKRLIGYAILLLNEGRIPLRKTKKGKGYLALPVQLPFSGVDPGKVIALMEAAGLKQVESQSVQHLLDEDSKSFPLKYRWTFIETHNRFMVVGEKG